MIPGLHITRGAAADVDAALAVLREAAQWLIERGTPLWLPDELAPEPLRHAAEAGELCLARIGGEVAGMMLLQSRDPLFWPEAREGEALYVHRLAVRRAVAGRGVARAILDWAADEARSAGSAYLRLDCADRPKLRALYESCGFRFHSPKDVGRFSVARYERPVSPTP